MMEFPEALVGIVFAILALISGFFLITAGIGLSLIPPSVPIFGSASQISSVIYVSGGGILVTLGCVGLYSILRNSLGGSRGRGGFNR
jgi:hypothetical protein